MTIDPRSLRNAFGSFATGVTVITTVDADGGHFGLTANSFTSLSLDPPLVLFCLDYRSTSFSAFSESPHFAVNVLGADQRALSVNFAQSNVDKWEGVEFVTWETGCPILPGSIACLECDKEAIFEGGDHIIIVGRVQRMRYDDAIAGPLVFYKGRYSSLAPD